MIRKLRWEIGDSLGIREKGERADDDLVMKYLQENMENEEQLLLKCGKSFWDVTHAPEIFYHEKSEPFDPENLTEIDKRQLEGGHAPKPAFYEDNDDKSNDPMSLLFKKTEATEKAEPYARKGFYIRKEQDVALKQIAVSEGKDMSALMREILDNAIAHKSEKHNRNFLEEAEMILANRRSR